MARKFYTIMQKRSDGRVYPDLHKTTGVIYETQEEAEAELDSVGGMANYFHVVPLIAITVQEWEAA